jgi:hypothetical protein
VHRCIRATVGTDRGRTHTVPPGPGVADPRVPNLGYRLGYAWWTRRRCVSGYDRKVHGRMCLRSPRSEKSGAQGPGSARKSNGFAPARGREAAGRQPQRQRSGARAHGVAWQPRPRGAREARPHAQPSEGHMRVEKGHRADRRATRCTASRKRQELHKGIAGGRGRGLDSGHAAVAHLPELGTDLVTALAALDVNDLTHLHTPGHRMR